MSDDIGEMKKEKTQLSQDTHFITDFNLRSGVTVTRRNIRTNKCGFETISTIRAVLWGNLPNSIKNSDSLNMFKHMIKKWTPDNSHVRSTENS